MLTNSHSNLIKRILFRNVCRATGGGDECARNVLVMNCGSSSLKFKILNPANGECFLSGQVDRIQTNNTPRIKYKLAGDNFSEELSDNNYEKITGKVLDIAAKVDFEFIGHRVVHGGELFRDVTEMTEENLSQLSRISSLAPLHNPVQTSVIKFSRGRFPDKRQASVFDTGYHSQMAPHVFMYAVPLAWYRDHHVRKYGFHGPSHQYVVRSVGSVLGPGARIVSCHLGAGCSLAAAVTGEEWSRDTSMGFSPLSGLVMATRAGDIDPSVVTYISHKLQLSADQVLNALNKQSGFFGIAGTSDSRDLEEKYLTGDHLAELAVEMFCYNIAKTVAAFAVPLAGLDAIVFTGGIGEKSFIKRKKIADYLSFLGVSIDEELNNINGSRSSSGKISSTESKIGLYVVNTDEELMIAMQVSRLFS